MINCIENNLHFMRLFSFLSIIKRKKSYHDQGGEK